MWAIFNRAFEILKGYFFSCHLFLLRFLMSASSSALLSSTWTTQLIWSIQRSTSFCVISVTSMQPRIQVMIAVPSWSRYLSKISDQLTPLRSKCKFWAPTLVSKLNPFFRARRFANSCSKREEAPYCQQSMRGLQIWIWSVRRRLCRVHLPTLTPAH